MQSLRYFTKDEIDNLLYYGRRNSEFREILFNISDKNLLELLDKTKRYLNESH